MSLYTELVAAGIEVDNHESDLYFPSTDASLRILAQHPTERKTAGHFTNRVKGGLWIDVPFAYDPWWERRTKKGLTGSI